MYDHVGINPLDEFLDCFDGWGRLGIADADSARNALIIAFRIDDAPLEASLRQPFRKAERERRFATSRRAG
jgi:hypothetical protein